MLYYCLFHTCMTLLTGLYEGVFNTSLTGLKNVGKIILGGGGLRLVFMSLADAVQIFVSL